MEINISAINKNIRAGGVKHTELTTCGLNVKSSYHYDLNTIYVAIMLHKFISYIEG